MKAQGQSSPPGYERKDTTSSPCMKKHVAWSIKQEAGGWAFSAVRLPHKGLGEMNPSQLWETTMDPTRRTLLQVAIEDAVEADYTFTTLMGDQVDPRKAFIEQHAKEVAYLDI